MDITILETTVSLKEEHQEILTDTAEWLGISRNHLVYRLLSSALVRHNLDRKDFCTVDYQEEEGVRFTPMHVGLRGDVYEKCLDVRKLFKVSVSKFLAMAIEDLLEMIIRMLKGQQKDTDNYDHVYYIKSKNINHQVHYCAGHDVPIILPD